MPTVIDRMPLDVPVDSCTAAGADTVYSVVDPSAAEVPLQNLSVRWL